MRALRKIMAAALVAIMVTAAFAQDGDGSSQKLNAASQVQALINKGLFKNADEISALSQSLTPSEAQMLYARNEKQAWQTVFNWLIGFGVGSWIQGDTVGGLTATLGQTSGLGLLIGGAVLTFSSVDDMVDGDYGKFIGGCTLMGVGLALDIGFQIFSIIRGALYPQRYNSTLRSVLNPSRKENVSNVALMPAFSFDENNNFASTVAVRFAF